MFLNSAKHGCSENQTAERVSIKEIVFVLCIILFAGVIRIPSLTQPIGPDQGIMTVIGEGILHGKIPYRDFWEMASPAIFFTYALMFKVFGHSMAAIPLTDTLVSMFTTFLVFMLARLIWGRKAGYISALFFALFSSGVRLGMHAGGDIAFGTFWYIAQRETFMLPLVTGSLYFVICSERREKKLWSLIVSGFLAGLSFVYKFPALVMFACILFYLNWNILSGKAAKPVQTILKKNIALLSGFMFALIPFVVFFHVRGALPEMINVIFKYVYSVYGHTKHDLLTTISLGLRRTLFFGQENFILWVFFFTSSIYIAINDRRKENVLMALWGAASVMYVISHREFFGYHFLMIMPSFSVLAGYGIARAMKSNFSFRNVFSGEMEKTFIVIAVLLNIFIFATLVHAHYTKFYFYATDKITKEQYYDFFTAYPEHDYSFPASYKISQYLAKNTGPDDMIFVLGGIESVVYFLSQRESPSRFIFSWIIFSESHGRVKQAEEYREELLNDLSAKIPKYIAIVHPLETFREFQGIYQFIHDNYVLEKTFPDDRFIYVHKEHKVKRT
ncbi:MAG: hypothetical protein AMK71_08540 [Nitrospira bacterium SG8_35_4]|nr:MAG: hypothetical protein AMK71_08540 [Nitrospira bacterium SG8_35_4]